MNLDRFFQDKYTIAPWQYGDSSERVFLAKSDLRAFTVRYEFIPKQEMTYIPITLRVGGVPGWIITSVVEVVFFYFQGSGEVWAYPAGASKLLVPKWVKDYGVVDIPEGEVVPVPREEVERMVIYKFTPTL